MWLVAASAEIQENQRKSVIALNASFHAQMPMREAGETVRIVKVQTGTVIP
jgi:hypothetical protein